MKRKQPKVIELAMKQLRELAESRTIRDESGRVILQGYPEPGEVEKALRYVYRAGKRITLKP